VNPIFTCEDIRQYYYCPRIIYFRYVLRARVEETYKMRRGREKHRQILLGPNIERNVYLCSEELGLVGIIDALERREDGSVNIIEIKTGNTPTKMRDSHKAQLAAQAILVESVLGLKIRKIKVYNPETQRTMEINVVEYHREMARQALERMRQIVLREELPQPTKHRARCVDCEYRVFCEDNF